MKLINKGRLKIFLWIGLAYFTIGLFGDLLHHPEFFFKSILNNIWLASYLVALNYIVLEVVIPYLTISWKRLIVAPVFIFVLLMLYSFGFYAWRGIGIMLHLYAPITTASSILDGVRQHIAYSIFSIPFFALIRHIYDYRKLKEVAQQLRIEKQEAELNFLKSQTNPHFLFNTLNNIYALAREKSDVAPESILRLSKILRFMLYETSGTFIAIEHELKIIQDYIALEQLRYDESLNVNFNHNVEDMKQAVPPLILIPLVENAFKHGVSETTNRPFVDIHLSVTERILTFTVKNSSDSQAGVEVKENIGLANLRRQLKLLYREFDLHVEQSEGQFIATLKINLATNV